MLGAFALGIAVVIGWTALVSEAVDLSDRVRRARCDWVETLVVSVAGHELSIAATPWTTVYTGTKWISGEEMSGYRTRPARFAFCLGAPPDGPLPARSVTLVLEAARKPAERAGLPEVGGPILEIGDGALFLPDAPAPVGQATDMTVFYRNEDFGWPRMVTKGVSPDGFRIGAVCRDVSGGGWLCDVSVQDARLGLSYRFERLPVETAAFDAAPVPASFLGVAHGMRALGRMLEAEAVAQR
ncbi:MAG TPA: hypothetical protein DIU07_14570 [Rhodobacteraceae bacterium]|nr:hypothetical protein [Paracoccaceae bacterium]